MLRLCEVTTPLPIRNRTASAVLAGCCWLCSPHCEFNWPAHIAGSLDPTGDVRKECEMGSLGSSVLLCDGVADLGPGSALSLSMLGFDSEKLHHLQTQALSPSGEQFLKAQDHLSASMSDLVAELQEDGTGTSLGHMPGGFFTLAHKLEHLSASLQAAEGHGGALRQCANPTLGGDGWMPSPPEATQPAIPGAVAPPTSKAGHWHSLDSQTITELH
ncbi:hypothetical protein HaLaN_02371 [Haematococcus lacustris]|uniref:Uncharacterized protein n=1 Tax=Haematococcus lacustris TaxID=44745 RepID=A0A699YBV5_HAELA|nr:hypothetical protein HaLaN_02371 [Haematococcus lacustris]